MGLKFRNGLLVLGVITNLSASAASFQFARSSAAPLRVVVAVESAKNSAKSSVPIVVTLQNTSKAAVSFNDTDPEWDYRIELLDSKHRPAPLTKHGRRLPKSWSDRWSYEFRRVNITLKPGEAISTTIELSNIFALRGPGSYTVTVSRSLAPTADRPSLTGISSAVRFTLE